MESRPGTLQHLVDTIASACPQMLALGYQENPRVLQPVRGRLTRLHRFLRGKPTWTLRRTTGAVKFVVVCSEPVSHEERQAVRGILDLEKPAGVRVEVGFYEACSFERQPRDLDLSMIPEHQMERFQNIVSDR